jgi:hypothetical protein
MRRERPRLSAGARRRFGQPGCEATVVSNLVQKRDDQIGCPALAPIDNAEARVRRRDTTAAR